MGALVEGGLFAKGFLGGGVFEVALFGDGSSVEYLWYSAVWLVYVLNVETTNMAFVVFFVGKSLL